MIYVISIYDRSNEAEREVRTVAARSAVEALQAEGYSESQINLSYNSAFVNLSESTQLWAEKI